MERGIEPGRVVEFSGVARAVEGAGRILEFARVRSGEEQDSFEQKREFVLEREDGARVTIRPFASLAEGLAPQVERRVPWEELDEHLRKRFAGLAPGPGERVELSSARVNDGDEVVVIGRVAEVGPNPADAGSGYRAAPAHRILSVEASAVGVGSDALRAARRAMIVKDVDPDAGPRRPFPWRWVGAAPLLLPLVVVAARWLLGQPEGSQPFAWMAAFAWPCAGVFAWRAGGVLDPTTDAEPSGLLSASVSYVLLVLAGCSVALTMFADSGSDPQPVNPWLSVSFTAPLGLMALDASIRYLRIRAFARRFVPGPAWRVVQGRIVSQSRGGELVMSCPLGRKRVLLEGALKATEDVATETHGTIRGGTEWRFHRFVSGGGIVVGGRFETGDETLRVAGKGSLAVFASEKGHGALEALARRSRQAAELALMAASTCALCAAIGVVYA